MDSEPTIAAYIRRFRETAPLPPSERKPATRADFWWIEPNDCASSEVHDNNMVVTSHQHGYEDVVTMHMDKWVTSIERKYASNLASSSQLQHNTETDNEDFFIEFSNFLSESTKELTERSNSSFSVASGASASAIIAGMTDNQSKLSVVENYSHRDYGYLAPVQSILEDPEVTITRLRRRLGLLDEKSQNHVANETSSHIQNTYFPLSTAVEELGHLPTVPDITDAQHFLCPIGMQTEDGSFDANMRDMITTENDKKLSNDASRSEDKTPNDNCSHQAGDQGIAQVTNDIDSNLSLAPTHFQNQVDVETTIDKVISEVVALNLNYEQCKLERQSPVELTHPPLINVLQQTDITPSEDTLDSSDVHPCAIGTSKASDVEHISFERAPLFEVQNSNITPVLTKDCSVCVGVDHAVQIRQDSNHLSTKSLTCQFNCASIRSDHTNEESSAIKSTASDSVECKVSTHDLHLKVEGPLNNSVSVNTAANDVNQYHESSVESEHLSNKQSSIASWSQGEFMGSQHTSKVFSQCQQAKEQYKEQLDASLLLDVDEDQMACLNANCTIEENIPNEGTIKIDNQKPGSHLELPGRESLEESDGFENDEVVILLRKRIALYSKALEYRLTNDTAADDKISMA